jgi:glyoxylase-like metal-dependent hydrolase (beta-lactamase superfamily II)
VLAEVGDESLLVAGDLAVHMVQLLNPDVAYASDMDPDQARATRRRVVKEVIDRGATLAVSHLGAAFRRL